MKRMSTWVVLGMAVFGAGAAAIAVGEAPEARCADAVQAGAADSSAADTGAALKASADTETRAEVPALDTFHEVVAVLWHDAWPNKDLAKMRELLPEVQSGVKAVGEAKLPGILREKQARWNEGVVALAGALATYEEAAASGMEKPLLDAVETLHARFEDLVWTVRPAMDELGAYHTELYKIYHRHGPQREIEPLRAGAAALVERCAALSAAKTPRWFKGEEKTLRKEIEALCTATGNLTQVAAGEDWTAIEAGIETVHAQYRKVEALFD